MNPAGDHESLDERLARADRNIQRARLEEKIRELGGIMPVASNDNTSGEELAFLEYVLAWEKGPFATHCEWLARHGLVFAPPEELRGRALTVELWRMIAALAVACVFLYHTNHLSEAELYARLWHEVLDGSAPDFARTTDDARHWDFADAGSNGEDVWLTFYATEKEKSEWLGDIPGTVLPRHRMPPYLRDHRLPKRD
jgi:hypothetical protein